MICDAEAGMGCEPADRAANDETVSSMARVELPRKLSAQNTITLVDRQHELAENDLMLRVWLDSGLSLDVYLFEKENYGCWLSYRGE